MIDSARYVVLFFIYCLANGKSFDMNIMMVDICGLSVF
jgi:hypothetical protein